MLTLRESWRLCRRAPASSIHRPLGYWQPCHTYSTLHEAELVNLFDQKSQGYGSSLLRPTGLFRDLRLRTPESFITVANETLVQAESLVQRIVNAPSNRTEMFRVVKNLDRLSDMLCRVIDLAELVRSVHPDRAWVEKATEAYESLCEYMNVLNTHIGLDEVCFDNSHTRTVHVQTL